MKARIDVKKLVKALLAGISPRQKKILEGRFGLGGELLTLAAIGDGYSLTRERVRQIEKAALDNIRLFFNDGDPLKFVQFVISNMKKFNGVRGEDSLLADLGCSKADGSYVKFLLEASGKFNYKIEDKHFNNYWYLDAQANNKALEFISNLKNYLKNNRVAGYRPNTAFDVNYVSISRSFAYSPFNDFGLASWSEIYPQNAREWAYLVLKKEKRPLHFNELASLVDGLKKANKKTNAQTVHNELIKDDRFVLVGRGTYGLRELGLLPGTAKEVLAHFFKKHGPMKSHEVLKLVSQERTFKENTLLLNLQNRKHFQRLDDGRYTVKEA